MRPTRILFVRRMTNLTNLLYQELLNESLHIAYYRKPAKWVIRSNLDNKYINVLYFISFRAKHKIFII